MIPADTTIERRVEVYDGRRHLGAIIEKNRTFRAEDSDGFPIGKFPDYKAAHAAITRDRAICSGR